MSETESRETELSRLLNKQLQAAIQRVLGETIGERELNVVLNSLATVSGYYLSPVGDQSRRAFVKIMKDCQRQAAERGAFQEITGPAATGGLQ